MCSSQFIKLRKFPKGTLLEHVTYTFVNELIYNSQITIIIWAIIIYQCHVSVRYVHYRNHALVFNVSISGNQTLAFNVNISVNKALPFNVNRMRYM